MIRPEILTCGYFSSRLIDIVMPHLAELPEGLLHVERYTALHKTAEVGLGLHPKP